MELGEMHSRVCKLEKILTHLAKWTNFDLQKYNDSSADVNLVSSPLPLPVVGLHDPADTDPLQSNHEVDLDLGLGLDLGTVCKIEVDGDDDDDDGYEVELDVDLVESISESDDDKRDKGKKEIELNLLREENDLELDVDLNDPNYSTTPRPTTTTTTPSPCPSLTPDEEYQYISASGSCKTDSALKSKSQSISTLKLRGLKRKRAAVSSPMQRVVEMGKIRVLPSNSTSLALPSPFVSMDKLTSRQLLPYGIKINAGNFKCSNLGPGSKSSKGPQTTTTTTCSLTGKKSELKMLRSHLKIHSDRPSSSSRPRRRLKLRKHLKHKSSNPNVKPKDKCVDVEMERSQRQGVNKTLSCYFCSKLVKSRQKLEVHLRRHTEELPYMCSKCPYSTGDGSNFSRHARGFHNHNQNAIQMTTTAINCYFCNAKINSKNYDRKMKHHLRLHTCETPYKCSLCKYSAVNIHVMSRHFRRRHGQDSSQKTMHRDGDGADDQTPYKCPVCSSSYARKYYLRLHLKSAHFGLGGFSISKDSCKCPECPKTFSNLEGVRKHLKSVHLEKSFLCHFCPYVTTTQGYLNRHFRNVHDQDPTYSHCYFCPSKFKIYVELEKHLRQHTGEKPYKCSTCPYSTEDANRLNQHIRNLHKSDQKLRTIQCPKCPTMFASVWTLNQHAKLHGKTMYRCIICSHKAMNKSMLKKHVKEMHPKGEANFQCPHCPKKFKAKQRLETHVRTHTGEKPFECGKCAYATGNRSHLSRHVKRCKGTGRNQGAGEGEYASNPCDECGQVFTSVENVTSWHQTQTLDMHQSPHYNMSFNELQNYGYGYQLTSRQPSEIPPDEQEPLEALEVDLRMRMTAPE